MSQPIRGQGGHPVFPISPKNTNLVEDIEILLPVKFRWIPFSGFRGEVENVSANQRSGRPSCFSDRSEKHKLGRGCWVLASCQVLLNSVQWCQRRSRKYEKLTTDGRRTMRDHNSALEPSAQVHYKCHFWQFLGLQPPFRTEWWTKVVMKGCNPPFQKICYHYIAIQLN